IFGRGVETAGPDAYDLLTASRAAVDEPWGTPTLLDLSTPDYEADAHLDAAGRVPDFVAEPGRRDRQIALAPRADPTAPFGATILVTELNTAADDADPWVSPDGRLIVFSSEISGDQEIYQASR